MNRQLVLVARPAAAVGPEHFAMQTVAPGQVGPGQVRVRVVWLGFDPTQRGWLNDVPSYMPPVQLGEVMRAFGVGQVIESRSDRLTEGQWVSGLLGWQDEVVADAKMLTPAPAGIEPRALLGLYGSTGLTAYFGMLDIGDPRPGDLVVVSGAAGATGSVAGQIARIKGATVVGIAGGAEKCGWITDVARFDAAIDYKGESVGARLRELAPKGVNVYFDNVGGEILDTALSQIAQFARIVLCGGISSGYGAERSATGPANYFNLIIKSSKMQGFLLFDYARRFDEARAQIAAWDRAGEIVVQEDIQEGLENAPVTLQRLFDGKNLGKQLLRVAADR